jgi:hypothetical protein
MLQPAFTTDCVDGQLARYTRRFSQLGAWLDAVLDRGKEYAVYAGLALGGHGLWTLAGAALTLQTFRHTLEFSYQATPRAPAAVARRGGTGGTRQRCAAEATIHRGLAGATQQRGAAEATIHGGVADVTRRPRAAGAALHRGPRPASDGGPTLWLRKAIAFPIGERFAAISLTAALGSARLTFTVLLAWGAVAAAYTLAGRVRRSLT